MEPVFKALNQHLELLVNQAGGGVSAVAAPQSMQPRESQISSPQEPVSAKSPTSTAILEKTN